MDVIAMISRYVSFSFLGRVILFSLGYASMEAFYEFVRTGQLSFLSATSYFIAGILFALVLGLIFLQLSFRIGTRIGIAWLTLFIIQEFSNLLEGYFFTTYIPTVSLFFAAVFVSLLVTFIEASLVGILFVPKETGSVFVDEIKGYFDQRAGVSWILRIVVASLIYFPIYFTFGGLVAPFVIPYYMEASLGLVIPSFDVMVPLEFVRGFLYVLALLPIMAVLRVKRRHLYAAVVSLLYVPGAFVPFLVNPTLPIQLRMVHGLEILGDYLVYGAVLVYLLGKKGA